MKFACAILAVAVSAQTELSDDQKKACDAYKKALPNDTTSEAYKIACVPGTEIPDVDTDLTEEEIKKALCDSLEKDSEAWKTAECGGVSNIAVVGGSILAAAAALAF